MSIRRWATRQLKWGDLTALRWIAKGHKLTDDDRLRRLCRRGFVKPLDNTLHVTLIGWAAVTVKQLMIY